MSPFSRAVIITQTMRTQCLCGHGVELDFVCDESIAAALNLTDKPTESVARAALAVWEATHECPPTVDDLMSLLNLD
ncbi:hypothetical protein [Streptomyces sp. NPDC014733]|uniref:hypothetical protein n=1 Tax=Streptomyces sp. NPDC014733 TaxID=3364885 RepID=UPI0036F6275C